MSLRIDRRTLLGTATCALAGTAYSRVELSSMKKGFGTVPKNDPQWAAKLQALKAKWFYNWGTTAPEGIPPRIEFVPMQWGKWGCAAELAEQIKTAGYKALLAFNEPDQRTQANMTVENAIELWPYLESTGMRLGSPAGVHPDGEWMAAFMAEVDKRGYRVDFITIHAYLGKNSKNFIQRTEQIHKLYNRPLWITEFAVADWTASAEKPNKYSQADVYEFMEAALPALDTLDYVERYAWFSSCNTTPALASPALFNDDGSLNRLGELYASM